MSEQITVTLVATESTTVVSAATGDPTKDTAAIQAALNIGGRVLLGSGTWVVDPSTPLTIGGNTIWEGMGYESCIQVKDGAGLYYQVVTASGDNVSIRDIRFDQNVAGNAVQPIPGGGAGQNNVIVSTGDNFEVRGCYFDKITGQWAVNATGTGVRLIDNYVNFVTTYVSSLYDNTAFYVFADKQEITGNMFIGQPVASHVLAGGAIESHGGAAYIAGNFSENYDCIVRVVAADSGTDPVSNSIKVIGNTAKNCGHGINIWPGTTKTNTVTAHLLKDIDVSHNQIYVNNVARTGAYPGTNEPYTGIGFVYTDGTYILDGSVDGVRIIDNDIRFDASDNYAYVATPLFAGISVYSAAPLSNADVHGNKVVNAPLYGICVEPYTTNGYKNVRVHDNVMVDCGLCTGVSDGARGGLVMADGTGTIKDALIDRNHVLDTAASTTGGKYAWYVTVANASTIVWGDENTMSQGSGTALSVTLTALIGLPAGSGAGIPSITLLDAAFCNAVAANRGLLADWFQGLYHDTSGGLYYNCRVFMAGTTPTWLSVAVSVAS